MQEFENGDEVECKCFDAWLNSTIIGLNPDDDSQYIVVYDESFKSEVIEIKRGELDHCSRSFIRPVQLICDEARRLILETDTKFKISVATFQHLKELESFMNSDTCYRLLDADRATERDLNAFNGVQLPELNLETGEVTLCEDEEQKIDNCCHCYGMSQQLTQEQTNVDKLKHQLKENALEIAQLKEIGEKKDAEIEELKKHNKNLLSLRNIIYELTNTPYGHSFDLDMLNFSSSQFDIKVRSPNSTRE